MNETIVVINLKNPSRVSHFKKLASMNDHFTLIMKNPTWESEYFEKVVDVDTSNTVEVIRKIEELSQTNVLKGVVTFVEHAVPLTALIADYFELEGNCIESAVLTRDKNKMHEAFDKYAIPTANYALASSIDEATSRCSEIGYPVVLKPIIGGGSLSVVKIEDEEDLNVHFDTIRYETISEFEYDTLQKRICSKYRHAILVEKYIEGKEISVESIVVNGICHVIAIHDKILPMNGPYFEERLFTTPSRFPEKLLKTVTQLTKRAHKALKVEKSVTHTEFRITESGEVYILELGARIGGGPVYLSVLISTGIDLVENIIASATKKEIPIPNIDVQSKVGFQHFFSKTEGLVKAYGGDKCYMEDESVVEYLPYLKRGDKVSLPPNSVAHGHLIVKGDSYHEIESKLINAEKDIEIILEESQ